MKQEYLQVGRVINTHGVRGEVKIEPWCDSPQWFCALERVFVDGSPRALRGARPQGAFVLASLEGVEDLAGAIALKGTILYLHRDDVTLPEGFRFVEDLVGLTAVDEDGAVLGRIHDLLELPAGRVYEIRGTRELLIPDRPEFVLGVDDAAGTVRFRLIEGM